MSKAAFLASLFFAGCAANSLISWLAAMHPSGVSAGRFFYIVLIILCLAGIMLDDGIQPYTGLKPAAYYTVIAMIVLSALFGSGLVWLSN